MFEHDFKLKKWNKIEISTLVLFERSSSRKKNILYQKLYPIFDMRLIMCYNSFQAKSQGCFFFVVLQNSRYN